MGYLRALHVGLFEATYIAGMSGGSWASSVYSYAQLNISDEVLLGDITRRRIPAWEG